MIEGVPAHFSISGASILSYAVNANIISKCSDLLQKRLQITVAGLWRIQTALSLADILCNILGASTNSPIENKTKL
jgi:hypothetical protein